MGTRRMAWLSGFASMGAAVMMLPPPKHSIGVALALFVTAVCFAWLSVNLTRDHASQDKRK